MSACPGEEDSPHGTSISTAAEASSTGKGIGKFSKLGRDGDSDNKEGEPDASTNNHRKRSWNDDETTETKRSKHQLLEPQTLQPRLACPFYKLNPLKYSQKIEKFDYRACDRPGFKSITLLKAHLKRKHYRVQCGRCYRIFDGPDRVICTLELHEHLQLPTVCELGEASFEENISDAQWASINAKKWHWAASNIEKWNEIWRILFAGTEVPKSPWYDSEPPSHSLPPSEESGPKMSLFNEMLNHSVGHQGIHLEEGVQEQMIKNEQESHETWYKTFPSETDSFTISNIKNLKDSQFSGSDEHFPSFRSAPGYGLSASTQLSGKESFTGAQSQADVMSISKSLTAPSIFSHEGSRSHDIPPSLITTQYSHNIHATERPSFEHHNHNEISMDSSIFDEILSRNYSTCDIDYTDPSDRSGSDVEKPPDFAWMYFDASNTLFDHMVQRSSSNDGQQGRRHAGESKQSYKINELLDKNELRVDDEAEIETKDKKSIIKHRAIEQSPHLQALVAVLEPLVDSTKDSSISHLDSMDLEQEFDVQSIASLHTFYDSALGLSNPSILSMQDLPQSAQREVLHVLVSNEILRPLLEEAARKTDNARFTRNIRRALVQYAEELGRSATEAGEKAAAIVLRKHSQWLASSLFDVMKPDRDSSNQRMKDLLKQDIDGRLILERYLAEKSLHNAPPNNTMSSKFQEENESISVESDDGTEDDSEFPRLDHLRRFLTGGHAFANLEKKILDFLRPRNLPSTWKESHESDGAISSEEITRMPPAETRENPSGTSSTQVVVDNTKKEYPTVVETLTTMEEPQTVAELGQGPNSIEFENPPKSYNVLLGCNTDHHQFDPPCLDSQSQDHTTIEGSCQASTSTEQTDILLMDDEADDSDDDFGSPFMDGSEYADAKTEERILNPRTYFKKLETLEQEIYKTSSFWISKSNSDGMRNFSSHNYRCRVTPLSDKDDDLQILIKTLNEKHQSRLLQSLLECYNMIQRSHHNIQKMQAASFCGGYISVLVEKSDRIGVANLFRIESTKIVELYNKLEAALKALGSTKPGTLDQFVSNKSSLDAFLKDSIKDINLACGDILKCIGLRCAINFTSIKLWQRTAQIVDFAILCYVGAHIEPFDSKILDINVSYFQFRDSGLYFDLKYPKLELSVTEVQGTVFSSKDDIEEQLNLSWPPFALRRRRLQCLDHFLKGMEVWVFQQSANELQDDTRLCLSTDIETFTDIWGPLWKILRKSSPGQIERLEIGNGSIVPWAPQPHLSPPDIRLGEVYCHWIPLKGWNSDEIEAHQKGLERRYFLETDKLLIGAKEGGLLVNKECNLTVVCLRDIKSKLHDESALQRPGTDRPRRYTDSYALQVQGSVLSAVSGAAMVTYKRRNGQSMKDTLVERWRNTKNRNPGELEAFCGIEVSICTQNARRRRLLGLLNSNTMRNYLKGIHFEWDSDECESAYFESLSNRRTFRRFWNRCREWRKSAGEAISLCLDKLELTGIDEDNGELCAFRADMFDEDEYAPTEEWLVKLVRKEHTWTRFLRDSPEVLTMAVMDSKCLDFNDFMGYSRRCQQSGSSSPEGRAKICKQLGFAVLETAIHVNEKVASDLIKDGKLEKIASDKPGIYTWSTENMKKNTEFCLGDQGTLAVYAPSNYCCPPIMSWHPVRSEKLQEFKNVCVREHILGGYTEKHHHEYISGSWTCKPFRILVLSESTASTGK